MKLLHQILFVARIETGFFLRYPKLLLAALMVTFVPAAYSLIYLGSVWDPEAHARALPVAIVNHDLGTTFRGQQFNIGNEIVNTLLRQKQFGFSVSSDELKVRRSVQDGKIAFALIIPAQFSENAVPGKENPDARPIILVSEGNNYESAALGRHFGEILGHQANKALNERRWALTLDTAANLQQQVGELRAGVGQLEHGAQLLAHGTGETASGAQSLARGSGQLRDGVGRLTVGVKQFRSGLKTADDSLPSETELKRLSTGAESLAAGQSQLEHGIKALKEGTEQLNSGLTNFREEASDSIFIPTSVVTGADELSQGISRIGSGLDTAWTAQQQLSDGANKLNNGVQRLTEGVNTLKTGLHTAAGQLPEEEQLDRIAHGSEEIESGANALYKATTQLSSGSNRLADGLEKLAGALPSRIEALEGSPAGLADSVQAQIEVTARVGSPGAGFAPNIIAGALWLGGGVAAFLLHIRVLPSHARLFPPLIQYLGKILFPVGVVIVQSLLVIFALRYLLNIHVIDPGGFALTLCIASMSFLMIIFALARSFGDAGKGLAMVLLAVQFSSSGGILPVELSGGLYSYISPWLPMTWTIKALRATMFGAYNGAWCSDVLLLCGVGIIATALGCVIGRWRFTHPDQMLPTVDF